MDDEKSVLLEPPSLCIKRAHPLNESNRNRMNHRRNNYPSSNGKLFPILPRLSFLLLLARYVNLFHIGATSWRSFSFSP